MIYNLIVTEFEKAIIDLSNEKKPRILKLDQRPIFSFDYDNLYYEEFNKKYVRDDVDYLITEDIEKEIISFIDQQLLSPFIVNGVDENGKYMKEVPLHLVTREVASHPPFQGVWRLDLSKEGEHWYQPLCVDAEGRFLENPENEDNVAQFVPYEPPTLDDYWRWQNETWTDTRPHEVRLEEAKNNKLTELKNRWLYSSELGIVKIKRGGRIYSFGTDYHTLATIQNAVFNITNGISQTEVIYAKGETEPVNWAKNELIVILAEINKFRNEKTHKYFEEKEIVQNMTKAGEVISFESELECDTCDA